MVLTAVTSIDPAANTHDSPVSSGISVTFDQDINATTVSDDSFVIHGSQWGQFTGAQGSVFGTSGAAIEYSPAFGLDFQPGELVQVTLTSNMRSTFGEAVDSTVWQFRAQPTKGSGFFTTVRLSPRPRRWDWPWAT